MNNIYIKSNPEELFESELQYRYILRDEDTAKKLQYMIKRKEETQKPINILRWQLESIEKAILYRA